jgi:hypothetical protein
MKGGNRAWSSDEGFESAARPFDDVDIAAFTRGTAMSIEPRLFGL